jgi:hypothetical protein
MLTNSFAATVSETSFSACVARRAKPWKTPPRNWTKYLATCSTEIFAAAKAQTSSLRDAVALNDVLVEIEPQAGALWDEHLSVGELQRLPVQDIVVGIVFDR